MYTMKAEILVNTVVISCMKTIISLQGLGFGARLLSPIDPAETEEINNADTAPLTGPLTLLDEEVLNTVTNIIACSKY